MSNDEMHAMVEIADVVPAAVKKRADEITVGATVFDVWGNEYKVTKVQLTTHRIKITRDDDQVDSFPRDCTFTFIPAPTDK
ncbi:hypothetical protein ACFRAQ_34800 [Nocardia sp. NPDC056611]|uniref:hypothetical protein n=1 Tax=Nocardia sp. NPDC056611 TaxID=3345877 RepID=UPI00366E9D7D